MPIVIVVLRFPRSGVHVCIRPNKSSRASAVWNDKSHGSLTGRSVTRATENKIDTDKHRIMHIHASTLYKRICQHRPATDTESTTHTTSHANTSTSSSRTHTFTHADKTSNMHKCRITHYNRLHTHIHTVTHTVTDKVKHTL
jgi:hypothetical protein